MLASMDVSKHWTLFFSFSILSSSDYVEQMVLFSSKELFIMIFLVRNENMMGTLIHNEEEHRKMLLLRLVNAQFIDF